MRTTCWLLRIGMAVALATFLAPALGIINPRFTPADLIRTSSQIILLRVFAPQEKYVEAEVVETLQGEALDEKKLKLDFADAEDLSTDEITDALGGVKAADAVLLLAKRQRQGGDTPVGFLQIGTQWFAVYRKQGRLCLDKDKRDMFAIWAGSARMLAKAIRYVQSEPLAKFPVRAEMAWGESLRLGKLAGPAGGCLVADLSQPTGLCAIVLSEAGDRAYRAARKDGKPTDVTAQVRLGTASKAAAIGDFDGDGRVDLISWDGRALRLTAQTAEGAFAAPKECAQLSECLSLDCIDAGGLRPALVAGTSQGPVLLVWDAGGALKVQPLASDKESLAKLGPGGLCVVADFNGDGRSDVMALFTKGALLYAGEGPGRFKAPESIALPLVDRPCAAVCGDFDADGLLDVIVAGKDGLTLLSRESPDRWSNITYLTGELAYHGNANRPQVTGCAPCDVNTDGRQGMALFYADRKPLLFFNRGFACFGWARELDLDPSSAATDSGAGPPEDILGQPKPASAGGPEDLKQGQTTGVILDLNGDGVPDMLAVGAKEREVWAVFGCRQEDQPRRTCVLILPPVAPGPITVTVRDGSRIAGMYVVRPGIPAFVGRAQAGPMVLGWIGRDGRAVSREVVVPDEGGCFEIKPGSDDPAGH